MSVPRYLLRRAAPLRQALQRRTFSASSRNLAEAVRIVEVGPRDGLQNEKKTISLQTKLELIRRLAQTGVKDMEAGSFVAPKWVPQMSSSADIYKELLHRPPEAPQPIAYNFLVPNTRGLDNMLAVSAELAPSSNPSSPMTAEVSLFTAATEAFCRANTNCSIAESLERCRPIAEKAKAAGLRVRGYVSVALGCPYEGLDVSPQKVADITRSLLEMGAYEVSVADTTGMGTAPRTRALLDALRAAGIVQGDLALHFHDTYGQALINTVVGLEGGIRSFDSSVGGLGGCPYSPGATGNVATEDLVYCLHSLGCETGIDTRKMAEIGAWISAELGRNNASRAGKALLAKATAA